MLKLLSAISQVSIMPRPKVDRSPMKLLIGDPIIPLWSHQYQCTGWTRSLKRVQNVVWGDWCATRDLRIDVEWDICLMWWDSWHVCWSVIHWKASTLISWKVNKVWVQCRGVRMGSYRQIWCLEWVRVYHLLPTEMLAVPSQCTLW